MFALERCTDHITFSPAIDEDSGRESTNEAFKGEELMFSLSNREGTET